MEFLIMEILILLKAHAGYLQVDIIQVDTDGILNSGDLNSIKGPCRVFAGGYYPGGYTCKYPAWALNRIKMKTRNPTIKRNNNNQNKSGTDTTQKPYIIVPYHRGPSESFKKTCNNNGVQVYFKGGTTIKNLLMAPKDQDPMKSRSGIIYRFKCNRVECDDEYIGESSRTFGERF